MSSADLRYPPRTLWADYMRAAAGLVLCGLPLLALDVNRWLAVVLGAGHCVENFQALKGMFMDARR